MSFLREQRSSSTPKSAQPTLAQERAAATKRAGHGTEVATSHDKGAEHSAEPSSLPWIVERLFFLSFVALIVYFAPSKAHLQSQLVSPSEGTLVLYLLYFSIDKASPHAPSVVVFTCALSLNSALLLGVRFGLLAAIPAPAFASSVLWPHELSRRMGGAPDEIGGAPDEIGATVLPAIALLLWPMLAMLADLRLRWGELHVLGENLGENLETSSVAIEGALGRISVRISVALAHVLEARGAPARPRYTKDVAA
eukprot:jgi/Chrpa1/11502/Chrysochromulina_OHIO_Genome00012841-RA